MSIEKGLIERLDSDRKIETKQNFEKLIQQEQYIGDLYSINYENAPFNRQTLIQAPKGQTISGEIVQQAIDESKRTKKPIEKNLQRLFSDAKITSILSPGDGIPKMTKRSGKK